MKSFDKPEAAGEKGRLGRAPHVLSMFIAVLLATVMWYAVSVRDRLEAQVEVNIDYYGIPSNLVVTDGLVSKLTVRLRGPETLLRSIPRERLTEGIDLSDIKKGETIVPLGRDELGPAFRAFEVVDIQPPRIVIHADTVLERSVPVQAKEESPLHNDALTVENLSVSPATVILRGPEQVINTITRLPLTIKLDPKAAGTTVQQTITLDTPSLVTANPPSVRVRYTITSGRTVVSRHCTIKVDSDADHHYTVTPHELTVLVEVPEALAKNSKYLQGMAVSVLPPGMEVGETRQVKLRFRLPEGMTLLNPANDDVKVTRTK
ncbi:MAG: YbbR-like domain-containing protein [Desulfovibrio sp.]|nr:YbbR-like domain-containing protein [Desulfovibrio sp.]